MSISEQGNASLHTFAMQRTQRNLSFVSYCEPAFSVMKAVLDKEVNSRGLYSCTTFSYSVICWDIQPLHFFSFSTYKTTAKVYSLHYHSSFLALSLLAEYHELYELQRKRIEDQVGKFRHPEAGSNDEIVCSLEDISYSTSNSHVVVANDIHVLTQEDNDTMPE